KRLEEHPMENGQQKTDGPGGRLPFSRLYTSLHERQICHAEDKHYCVETRLYPAAVSGLIGEASVKQRSISSNNRAELTG
ncbi:hypothetical protein ASPBRDRAFT_126151, partial [Aspergillus brasiliensis CBS 101740]